MSGWEIVAALVLLGAPGTAATPAAASLPEDGSVIVFFGDSITQAGHYVEYIDAFLAARHPDLRYRVLNRGISSETLSGTSEPDHAPRRPCALDRFTRDIVAARPDVLVACFGMNDGNYFPFDPERFTRYQQGVRRLIERTRRKLHARLILLTPPPYDAYARTVLDPDAISFGYKFPAIEYDETLERYSAWLLALHEPGVQVVDVHAAMNRHLRERRDKRVSFRLQDDGIHPTTTGHWIMALTLLEAWGVTDLGDEARVDAAHKTSSGQVAGLEVTTAAVTFTWRSKLPMPRGPDWDAESVALEQRRTRLKPPRLTVTGLAAGRYHLRVDDRSVATMSAEQLGEGLDLLALSAFPATRMSQDVLAKVHQRQRLEVLLWRRQVMQTAPADGLDTNRSDGDLHNELDGLDREIRELCRPRDVRIVIERAE